MNKILLIIAAFTFTMSMSAQESDEVKKLYTQRAAQYAERFELDGETTAKFIEVFVEWQSNRGNLVDKKGNIVGPAENVKFKKITEEEATKLFEDECERQIKQAEADRQYFVKLREIVSTQQAAQIVLSQRNSMAGRMGNFGNFGGGGMGGGMGNMMMMMGGFGL